MSILNSQLSVTSTPLVEGGARGLGTLDSDQASVVIGNPIHIAFGKRLSNSGGVLVSPPATEARFESYIDGGVEYIKAYYQLVLSDGEIGRIQVRDVFQQSCRVGTSYTAYNTRAGQWVAGNALSSSVDVPQFCGTGGSYQGLTMMSFENAIPSEFEQWKRQVHVFVRNGVKVDRLIEQDTDSSNNFADLVYYLLQRTARLPISQVDTDSLTIAARFLAINSLWCDTLLQQSGNLVDWLQKTAPLFLLRRARINGKEGLKPLVQTNADGTINTGFIPWTYTFTNEHILKDGFEVRYTALSDRKPFAALMMWRQQPDDDIGLVRTTEVRYFGTATSGPYEQHDLTQYVTTEDHAVKVGAYILARRRYIEHTLRLIVAPGAYLGSIAVGDIVRVQTSNTDQSNNTLDHDYLYEVDSISKTLTGNVELQLTHFPIDNQGRSLVALDVFRAQGSNFLLPTGRDAVSCDSNDPFDVTLLAVWPTIDWGFSFDFAFDVPIGDGTWTYDPTDQEWDNPDYSPVVSPDVLYPDSVDVEVPPPSTTLFNSASGTPPAIQLSEVAVSYPRTTYYNVYDPDYALVSGTVSIDRPPLGNLDVYLLTPSGEVRLTIVMPGLGDEAPYETAFSVPVTLGQPFYCRGGAVSVNRIDGGGYSEYTLPDDQGYTVCPYVGTASLSDISFTSTQCAVTVSLDKPCVTDPAVIKIAVGDFHWDWDRETETWRWTTDSYPAQELPKVVDVEFETNTALIGDYLYNAITGSWVYIGTETPGSPPATPSAPSPAAITVDYSTVPDALQPNLRVWILEARQGGFSSIYYDPAKQIASPPVGPAPDLLMHFDEHDTWDGKVFTNSSNAIDWQFLQMFTTDVGTITLTTAQKKFGASSLDLTATISAFAFIAYDKTDGPIYTSDQDWAIDFWIYSTLASYSPLKPGRLAAFGIGTAIYQGIFINIEGSAIRLRAANLGTYPVDISTNNTISANTWHHIAIEYYSGTFYIYLDGIVSTNTHTGAYTINFQDWYMMYSDSDFPNPLVTQFRGYLDEVRLSSYAPYQGQSFTPNTEAYPNP